MQRVQAGDTVIGSLPVNLAEEVCRRKARYLHLSLELPHEWRGKELTALDLHKLDAKLQAYCIQKEDVNSV